MFYSRKTGTCIQGNVCAWSKGDKSTKKLQYFKSLNELPPLSRQPVSQMNTLY